MTTALARGVIIYNVHVHGRKLDRVGRSVALVMTGALVGSYGCYIPPIRFNGEWYDIDWLLWKLILRAGCLGLVRKPLGKWLIRCMIMNIIILFHGIYVFHAVYNLFYNHCRCNVPVYTEIGP